MSSNPATSSGLLSADAAVSTAPGILLSVILIGDGTNACNVVLYDNASAASGTVLAKASLPASGTTVHLNFSDVGVVINNGIFADVTGTGAAYIIHFTRG